MGRAYDVVVFDWDGTLADSTGPIAQCMQAACRDLGLNVPTLAAAQHVIGLGLEDALARLVPELPPSAYGRLVEAYRRNYFARPVPHPLFEGIGALLDELADRGVALAVATGKSVAGLQRSLAETGLGGRFQALRTADVTAPKPDPLMLQEISWELDVPPEWMLMVGDTAYDLEMASRAGAAAVGVSYGAHPVEDLQRWPSRALVHSPAELAQLLPRLL
jgi:phosphoglycolate phosphatase